MPLEKDFQTKFSRWLKHEYKGSGVFELKLGTSSIAFDRLEEHQANALYQEKHGSINFKIPDAGYQNPFDCFCMSGQPAYVVVAFKNEWDKCRGNQVKEFFMIDIDDWMKEVKTSLRKSLTPKRAREIGLNRAFKN